MNSKKTQLTTQNPIFERHRFSLASRRTRALDVPTGGRAAGPAALGSGGLAAATMLRCQRRIVSGVTSSRRPGAVLRYHTQQSREQCPVRPGQVRAARLPPLQDGELVAQDQDLRGLPRLLTPGQPQPRGHPRNEEEHRVGPRARFRGHHRPFPAVPPPHPACDSTAPGAPRALP